ncbi:Glu/Leu/Phe/Val dehydrogenase [bacterium SCSIO 12741]|nr:Glu/Leu/Phe/Val dehydrogenase [bacterium SCSIO 12741]
MENLSVECNVLELMAQNEHEQVVFCQDKNSGLKAIIAIHDTTLGPALGGTRMWQYDNEAQALNDVLRLSRGMSYKASISGLNLGGGKAVIIGDSRTQKNEALMRRFGKFVDSLSGKYITAEDVGMSPRDMEYIHDETDHVVGLPSALGGGGDPSPVTAYGVYMGMKASAQYVYGTDSLEGKKVVVQGAGHVGEHLIGYLTNEGAKVAVSDIFEDKIKYITDKYSGVEVVAADAIYGEQMDIYAPCALGATVNNETLDQLTCKIIAGAANNQLQNEQIHGRMVMEKGMVYAPDFLINAGGLINCYSELEGYNRERAFSKTESIFDTTLQILKVSEEKNIPTYQAANELAEKRIAAIGNINRTL